MAVHDQERPSARDHIRDAGNDDSTAGVTAKWIGVIVGVLLLGVILLMVVAPSQDPTGGITRSPAETAPTTNSVPQSPNPSPTGPTTQPQ